MRLEPMTAEHVSPLAEAARDGELWRLWFTAVPEGIDGMKKYGTTLEDNIDGLRSGDQAELQKAAQNIGKASTDFSTDFGQLVTDINSELGAGS